MQTRFTPFAFHSAAIAVVTTAVLATATQAVAQPVPAPQVAARAWMLTDVTSGQVLGGGNMDEQIGRAHV